MWSGWGSGRVESSWRIPLSQRIAQSHRWSNEVSHTYSPVNVFLIRFHAIVGDKGKRSEV